MATQLQIRRGTSTQVAAFTGAEGEIVVNTTNDSVHVNDGSTAGGFELARADLNNVSDTDLNAALTGNTVSALTVTTLTAGAFTSNGIDDNGTSTAITIDSSENVLVGTTTHRNFSGDTTEITVGTTATGATKGGAVTFGSGSGFLGYLAFQESEGTLGTLTSVPLVFKTGNTERMRLTTTGLGVGTTSLTPNATLSVAQGGVHVDGGASGGSSQVILSTGASSGSNFGQISNTGTRWALGYGGTQQTVGTEVLTWNSSNNVGIGTTSPQAAKFSSTASGILELANTKPVINIHETDVTDAEFFMGMSGGSAVIGTTGNGQLIFQTGTSSASISALIDASGNLLVGDTSSSFPTNVRAFKVFEASIAISHNTSNTSGDSYVRFGYSTNTIGSITQNGTTAVLYNTSSDQRLKSSIVDAPSASDDIDAIQVRSFDWKADGSHQKYGMVAQELQSVAPEAVSTPEDPNDMMGVDYSKLVPMLVKEIQSLRARVQQLENN